MTVNQTSLLGFKRETTAGTAIITIATTPTSEFGGYEDNQKVEQPTEVNELTEFWDYDSKSPNIEYGSKDFPEFITKFHPCSPICDYQYLGYGDAGAPAIVQMRNTGKKDSYTIRHEQQGGTNDLRQAVGCYNVGIKAKVEMNKEMEIEQLWIPQSLEDDGDRAALTVLPSYPEDIDEVYGDKPCITWDDGVGDVALPEIYKAEWSGKHNYTVVRTGTTYTINLHEMTGIPLRLTGILLTRTQWNALKDKETLNIRCRVYKQSDITKYADWIFYNCKIIGNIGTGKIYEGAYEGIIDLKAEYYKTEFVNEFGANFTDWFVNAAP